MHSLSGLPPALSIKQPWVNLIFAGIKTIEVREWRVAHRGPLLIHASGTLDWKTVELLGCDNALKLPRGGLVGVVSIADVIEFSRRTWLELMPQHRVVHPPVREPVFGAVLTEVVAFEHRIPCRGRRKLFPVPSAAEERTFAELARIGFVRR